MASDAVAEQARALPATTPVDGEIDAVDMVGAVLSTLTLAEDEAVAPELSVTVAAQLMAVDAAVCEATV